MKNREGWARACAKAIEILDHPAQAPEGDAVAQAIEALEEQVCAFMDDKQWPVALDALIAAVRAETPQRAQEQPSKIENDIETRFALIVAGELDHYAAKLANKALRRCLRELRVDALREGGQATFPSSIVARVDPDEVPFDSPDAREDAHGPLAQGEPLKVAVPLVSDDVIACDQFKEVRLNMAAIVLTIKAIRQIERCGTSSLLERAFKGFSALPETAGPSGGKP